MMHRRDLMAAVEDVALHRRNCHLCGRTFVDEAALAAHHAAGGDERAECERWIRTHTYSPPIIWRVVQDD